MVPSPQLSLNMILSIDYDRDNYDNNETDDDKEVSIFYLNLAWR